MRNLWSSLRASRRRAIRDLVWLGLGALVVSIAGFVLDISGRLYFMFVALGAGRGEVGFVLGVLMVASAIFGLRRWRDALDSQRRARNIFDEAAVGMFQSTPEGRFLRVNQSLAQILGYDSPQELIARFDDISKQLYVNPSDRTHFIQTVSARGVIREIQEQVYRKDGTKIWVEVSARMVRDDRGTIAYIEGMVEDVTSRKETEDAYRRLVDQSLQGILIIQDGRLVFANQAAAEIFGQAVEKLMALSVEGVTQLIHADDRKTVRARIEARLNGENVPSRSVSQVTRGDGGVRWVEFAANRIEYRSAPAVLAVVADITERKHAQDAMQETMQRTQMREELGAALARAGSDLTSVVNTLARVIVGTVIQSCTVMLFGADGESLEPVAYYHPNPQIAKTIRAMLLGSQITVRGLLYAQAIEEGQPLLREQIDVADPEHLGVGQFARVLRQFRTYSLLLVPLRAQTKTIGVVVLARHLPEPTFQANDLYLLQELADRAALAIANAQLVEQLHQELGARRVAEAKYRTLVEQIPVITYTASSERIGETLYVSPQVQAILGFTVQEWLATPDLWVTQLHPDDRAAVLKEAQHARAAGMPFRCEYRLLAHDGSVHWIRDEATFVLDDAQNPLYQHGIMFDITPYKLLETKYAQAIKNADVERAELKRELLDIRDNSLQLPVDAPVQLSLSDSLSRALVENTTDLYAAIDAEGIVRFVNPSVQTHFGYTPTDLIGNNFSDYIHADDLGLLSKKLEALQAQERGVEKIPMVRVRAQDGKWHLVDGIALNRIQDPETRAILFVARDVTEEIEQERARESALAAEREERAFAQAVGDAAALLIRAPQVEGVLDGILDVVGRIVPYDTASIFMCEGAVLRLVRSRGFDNYGLAEWIQTVTFSADTHKFRMLVQDRAPIVIADTTEYEGWIVLPETTWIRSNVTAPLRLGQETVGMIGLDSAVPGFYKPEHGARLMAFGDLAAAAMWNARLMDETRQRAGAFQALSEITRDLAIDTETPRLLETIVERAMLLMHCQVSYLYTYDPRMRDLVLVVCRGMDLPAGYRIPMGEGLVGQVALTQRALYNNDYRTYEHRVANIVSQSITAALGVPVIYGGELIGVLGVAERQARWQFDDNALSLLSLFAGHAASVLATSRLLDQTRLRAEQLALLYDVGLTINRVLESRTQMEFLFKIAQRALHAEQMSYFRYDPLSEMVVYELGVGVPAAVASRLEQTPFSVPNGDGLVSWIAKQRLPALVPEVNRDERWHLFGETAFSAVGAPVEHEKELRGVIVAVRSRPESFSALDERLLILFANQVAAAMELTHLFQAQTQRQRELEILREASLAFAAATDREALTTLILQFALRLVVAQNAFLFFYHDDQLEFGGMLWSDNSPMRPEHFKPRREGLTHTVARTGQMIVINDVNSHPIFNNWRWGGAIIGLPLKGAGQVRAVLNVAHRESHHFMPAEVRALELLADQAAVFLENARHIEETQQQLRVAQLLHRAGEASNRNLSFQETLERLADFFMQAVAVEMFSMMRVDIERDELEQLIDRDPLPETRAQPGTKYRLSDYPYLVQAVQEKKTLAVRRDQPDINPHTAETMDSYRWKALLAVPLFAGDVVIGLIELADQNECRDFSADELRLAESLSHQAASVLQNARMLQQAQDRAKQLDLLKRLADGVNEIPAPDELWDFIEREMQAALPADSSFIASYDETEGLVEFHRFRDNGIAFAPFSWRLAPGFIRQVITTGSALRMNEQMEQAAVENLPYDGSSTAMRSVLIVPIRLASRIIGLLSVQSLQPHMYTEQEEQLLEMIASQVALAFDRARRPLLERV